MPRSHVFCAALLLTTSASTALAQASGDGFQGPRVFDDMALDQSLAAMNRELQEAYVRKDTIAGLVQPLVSDFTELSVAVLDRPEPDGLITGPGLETTAFSEVSGDQSLDAALVAINQRELDRERFLFLQVARASAGDVQDQFDDGLVDKTEFGPSIVGDITLNAKMVHLVDMIAPEDADPSSLSVDVEFFDDTSLDTYGSALVIGPTEL